MRFSIIIPVFNAEQYLNEAIESVVNQTFDFKQNTEIILVDDGSTDSSQEICNSYVSQYPANIKYFYCRNSGPGNARNIGLSLVDSTTDYIGFLDADDYLSANTLEKMNSFFSSNPSVQLAVIPLYHFERIDTPHRLNYRFVKGNRVIDITEEYKAIHFHIGGCFFNAEHFTGNKKLRFDTTLKFWEDALLINTFLLNHKQYGVVAEPKYYYRKRTDGDSLVNTAWYQKPRYTEMLHKCYLSVVNESKSLYGETIPYVQFLIIYHIRLYLFPKNNEIIYEVLNKKEQEEFFHELVKLIKEFNNKYIKQQDMPFYYKNYLLALKKQGWPYKGTNRNIEKQEVTITNLKRKWFNWEIEGHFMNTEYMMNPEDQLFIKVRNKIIYLPKNKLPDKKRIIWGTIVRNYEYSGFKASLSPFYNEFQFGIKTEQGEFLLNKVNLRESTFIKK